VLGVGTSDEVDEEAVGDPHVEIGEQLRIAEEFGRVHGVIHRVDDDSDGLGSAESQAIVR
jgi:hypothetical protein